jgi:hypothetical protein
MVKVAISDHQGQRIKHRQSGQWLRWLLATTKANESSIANLVNG